MKTKLVSIEQTGQVDNGEIVAVLSGEGFHQAEFDDMLKFLQRRAKNVADVQCKIQQSKVELTFILKGAPVTEQMEWASMEAYLVYQWCPKRDMARRAQAC